MRYRHAVPLLRTAEPADSGTGRRLAWLLIDQGRAEEALALLRALAEAGVPFADHRLIATLAAMGRQQDAYRLARCGLTPEGDIESRPAQPG